MSYFEQLNELQEERNEIRKREIRLQKQKEKEIALATLEIDNKHLEEQRRINSDYEYNSQSLTNTCNMISIYSSFSPNDIGEIISSLMSRIEGKHFIYQKAVLKEKRRSNNSFTIDIGPVEKPLILIVRFEEKKDSYYKEDIQNLVSQNRALILKDEESITSDIYFYYANRATKELVPTINLKNFDYVQEFIDYIIDYKIKNRLTAITTENLYQLLNEFIIDREDSIKRTRHL